MKLVAISDTHYKHNSIQPLPEGDVLIHAGDSLGHGTDFELSYFVEWFSTHSYKYKILIAGNHDWFFEREPKTARKMVEDAGIIYLNDSGILIEGFNFWGSPVQPEFNSWAFNRQRGKEIAKHWKKIPVNTDVLITHGPPYGILDTTPMTNGPVGCIDLRERVLNKVKPTVHIFGHIHSAHGLQVVDNTTFINVAQIDDYYRLVPSYKPVVFEL